MRLIRNPAVEAATGYSEPTIKRRTKDGLFPPPVKIGKRAIARIESEVLAVNAARAAGRTDDEIRALVADLVRQRTAVAA